MPMPLSGCTAGHCVHQRGSEGLQHACHCCRAGLWPKLAPLAPTGALLCCTTNSMLLGSTCLLPGAECMQADMRGQAAQPADLPISSRKVLEVSLSLAVGMWDSTFGNRCCRSVFEAWNSFRTNVEPGDYDQHM